MIVRRLAAELLAAAVVILVVGGPALAGFDRSWHRDWHYFQHQADVSRMALLAGRPADYNPWHCSGSDLAENAQDLTTSPVFVAALVGGPAGGSRAMGLLVVVLGAAGMAWALRREGLRVGAAAAGGALWGLAPFMWAHLSEGHLPFAGFAWMPAALGLSAGMHRAAERRGRRAAMPWMGGVGGVLGAQLCFGGVYPFPYTALALGLDALVRVIRRRTWVPLASVAGAAALGLALAAPRLLPTLSLVGTLPRPRLHADSLEPSLLIDALSSRHVGSERIAGHPYDWPEYVLYPGVACVLLALVALLLTRRRRRPHAVGAGLLVIAGAWLMLGDVAGGLHGLMELLPLIGDLQVPSRLGILMICGLIWLAARGIDALSARGRVGQIAAAAVAVIALVEVGSLSRAWLAAGPTDEPFAASESLPPERAGDLPDADVRMDRAPALRHVISNCYEPGPHRVPPALAGDVALPWLQSERAGSTQVLEMAPGRVVIAGCAPGSELVLGQLFDSRWHIEGGRLSAAPGGITSVHPRAEKVVLTYTNPVRPLGLAIQLVVAALLLVGLYRVPRERATLSSNPNPTMVETSEEPP